MNESSRALKTASRSGIIWGMITVFFGFVAVGSPLVAGIWTTKFIAIALLAAGLSMTVFAFQAPSFGRLLVKVLFGILSILAGIAILSEPEIALAKLTLVLGFYFLADGFLGFVVSWNVKPNPGWGWMTLNAAVTIMLAWMILNGWPESALWVVGILVGVRLLFAGITMLTMGMAAKQASGTL